ncbi:tRNA uridine-5-carboxymethylaminomethyl(34) synthesis GTPase MnmE [Alcaligenes faecalis]|uniref:tRNA modification GTPase MnmE n=1 Tax=Alcaligenes nematophilus TaxID=2994643 RepID=A0ABU3MXU8_9BURK|nr:tRNA uridine-5-carboxymethylaminomethyl(34) synthesis GTPase MnmE [Alcaligenes nematophilus]KVX05726.1 tRNA modification GTPase TrmE [Alcaligenes faecalis]MCM2559457.1 tRNA uridine-5-carboxymethylaminomethyl(34) synthesis GTPase MnmE [Alcaligenes faecalis]MDT8464792.1 tRNA uridine-5-carboxymethylaminomethyl(34) synthesis GTPase MnmE [Alcaligenes nematophilus]MDT8469150.1 tRNA uridine-5-carboxymethylaminomethyl(34) synthesis GTPase MnmE [Alcaligenes nematophilus]MDT8505798.1 tRNA uridine-5-c
MSSSSPIVAIATAPGRGGIGVIRVSGKELDALIQTLFGRTLQARHAHFLPFKDAQGEAIDEGIALFFKGPHSYTGEDVLELQGHGGPAVLRRLLDRCLEAGKDQGLRLAEPGEFTQRAFLNDRLDLAQAEAVADLIDASSEAAARSAVASLSGVFSNNVNTLADRIIHLRMLVEATLDFPEEEIDFLEKYQAAATLQGIQDELERILQHSRQGAILREGLHVVLAGQPNVGKSSLLNALAGEDVAIVTDIAGTTRDRVMQLIHIDGIPLHIVDTAGLRETEDTVERIGIARTWDEIAKANVIVHLLDARNPQDELDSAITTRLPSHVPVLRVYNKIDLLTAEQQAALPAQENGATVLPISARKDIGLDTLRRTLLDIAGWNPGSESPWLARERHLRALERAEYHLSLAAEHATHSDQVLDLFAEELRLAHLDLCSITGEFSSDDLLGEIFSSFCIGK